MQAFKQFLEIFTLNSKIQPRRVNDLKRQELEESFYKTSKLFLITSEIFLTAPMGLHKPLWQRQPKDKILHYLHVLWCLGIYFALAACVYDEYTESNIDLPTTQKPLYFSEYLVYLIHLFELIRLINVRGGVIFWKFQSFIIDFDRDLLNFNMKCDYNELKGFLRQHMGLIVLHIICTIIIGYFYSNGILISFARTNTVYVLPNIIINISLIQYYALLYMIYKRSEKLCCLVDQHLNNRCSLDTWNCRLQLHYIRSLYARLEEFTQMVNNQFSISILLVYFGSTINLSVNIFLIYKYLKAWDTSDLAWIAYSLDWTFMHVGKMFLILYYNQKIQNMMNNVRNSLEILFNLIF